MRTPPGPGGPRGPFAPRPVGPPPIARPLAPGGGFPGGPVRPAGPVQRYPQQIPVQQYPSTIPPIGAAAPPPRPVMPPPGIARPAAGSGGQPQLQPWSQPWPPLISGIQPRKRANPAAVIIPVLVIALLLFFAPVGMFIARAPSNDASGVGDRPSPSNVGSPTHRPANHKPVLRTADNPIMTVAAPLQHVDCPLPPWESTPDAAERYFRTALPCLERAWKPVVERAGLPYRSPRLAFPAGRYWNSPCGAVGPEDKTAAFYCSGNNTLYMPFEGLGTKQIGDNHAAYLVSFAHEYGHHIQNTSGIMEAWLGDAYQNGGTDTDGGLELSRRSELQANCFAGMFLASVQGPDSLSERDATSGIDDRYVRGDGKGQPRDHGSPEHYGDWTAIGYGQNNTAKCNTWAAPSNAVS